MLIMEKSSAGSMGEGAMQGEEVDSRKFSKYERLLILFFLISLPFCNPWVRGDGVGYYAFARSLLIERNLDFEKDWQHGNETFAMGRVGADGQILADQYTPTGHLDNHFSIGPAILWLPFLAVAHAGVHLYDALGGRVPAGGFSEPYLVAMALGTAVYGFLALWISFRLARKYVPEGWAFLATLGIWFGSSLPVYMYFNPSWSHAQSAFVVAVFLWYWMRTRDERTASQWAILGLAGGLMMDVYYVNAALLLLPLFDALAGYRMAFREAGAVAAGRLLFKNAIFAAMLFAGFLPTLITKKIIYGSYFNFGYTEHWFRTSPAFFKVCFSANHGLFSWTPILVLAIGGLFLLQRYDRNLAFSLIAVFATYLYAIGCYENWHGLSSFGNRFFVSLTPIFILGLAAFFDSVARIWQERPAAIFASSVTAVFILWNLGLILQWGMHLIPARGPISWRDAAYNQVSAVPRQAAQSVGHYLTGRKQFLDRIEQQDVNQMRSRQTEGTE
jgi:hypothetical protein